MVSTCQVDLSERTRSTNWGFGGRAAPTLLPTLGFQRVIDSRLRTPYGKEQLDGWTFPSLRGTSRPRRIPATGEALRGRNLAAKLDWEGKNVETLVQYLRTMPRGRIDDPQELEPLLAACWYELDGGGGMSGDKLYGRMETVVWDPPVLYFVIERHGGTVMGSSRAELQHWRVDVQARTATLCEVGHRQLRPMQPRLDVKPLAEEIAPQIVGRRMDDRLQWYKNGRVRVLTGKVLPDSGAKQTREGRRKRFHKALAELLGKAGWTALGGGVYGADSITH